ncbi:hypothetical protein FRC17_009871 [Serendipita sp. 399]|nr:hypothetical protein FRC17_009871 [Serendipita sp. 399]
MASSSSRPSPSSTHSSSSRFQLPPFKKFIDALTPTNTFRHAQLSTERDYGARGAPDEPDEPGSNRLLTMFPIARPPSRTTISTTSSSSAATHHARGRDRADSSASSSAPTLSHRYGSPPPQPYSALSMSMMKAATGAAAGGSTSGAAAADDGSTAVTSTTTMTPVRSEERRFQQHPSLQNYATSSSVSDAPQAMTIHAQMNRDDHSHSHLPRRAYRRRSPSPPRQQQQQQQQPSYERSHHHRPTSDDYYHHSSPVHVSPRSSHLHPAHPRVHPHSEIPLPPPPRLQFPSDHHHHHQRGSHHQRQTSQIAGGAIGAHGESSVSSSSSPYTFSSPPDNHPSTSGAHSAILHHGKDLRLSGMTGQYASRSHSGGLLLGSPRSRSHLEPSGTIPQYLTTSQEHALPPRQSHHPPPPRANNNGYRPTETQAEYSSRGEPSRHAHLSSHRFDSPPRWMSDISASQRSGNNINNNNNDNDNVTFGEDERERDGRYFQNRHPRDEPRRGGGGVFQYEDAYNIIPGSSGNSNSQSGGGRDRSRSGTVTVQAYRRPSEEPYPDRSSQRTTHGQSSSGPIPAEDTRSSYAQGSTSGSGQQQSSSSAAAQGLGLPFPREASSRENIAAASLTMLGLKQIVLHRAKEDLERALTELSNEAQSAVQEGNALKKVQEFSRAISQFATICGGSSSPCVTPAPRRHPGVDARDVARSQDQGVVTPEDVEEMTHRASLVYRLSQHLSIHAKENTRPKKEEPPTFASLAKTTLSKAEQDTLDMMNEIARSRNFSKQGGKSKYQKRNVSDSLHLLHEWPTTPEWKELIRLQKKTQPPKLCSSCKIKETPEWRKGPEGPRTLCNACGLHWAKLMRNRNASGAKWIGDGPQPPIDIITLRQVTGVGPQLQANESGEFEMPGIYTNIPANRLLGEQHLPLHRAGRSSVVSSPANAPSVSSTSAAAPSQDVLQIDAVAPLSSTTAETTETVMATVPSTQTEIETVEAASQIPPPPPSTVESMEESATNEDVPSSPIEQSVGRKRKAESIDEDMANPDGTGAGASAGGPSMKRQRR